MKTKKITARKFHQTLGRGDVLIDGTRVTVTASSKSPRSGRIALASALGSFMFRPDDLLVVVEPELTALQIEHTARRIDIVLALAANEPAAQSDAGVIDLACEMIAKLNVSELSVPEGLREMVIERYDDGHGQFVAILQAAQ